MLGLLLPLFSASATVPAAIHLAWQDKIVIGRNLLAFLIPSLGFSEDGRDPPANLRFMFGSPAPGACCPGILCVM